MENNERQEANQEKFEKENEKKNENTENTEKDTEKEKKYFSAEYVEELRRENAKWRKKLRELEEKMQKEEEEKKKEQGKYQELYEEMKRKYEELESQIEAEKMEMELKKAAEKAGLIDPDLIRLADLSEVEFVNGTFIGLEKAIEDLRKAKPHLFKENEKEDAGIGGKGNSGNSSIKGFVDIYAKLKGMKKEERKIFLEKFNI